MVKRLEALFLRISDAEQYLIVLMLEGVVVQGRRRQVSQGAGWGKCESAICLSFPILLAKECS